ncbi:MAG: hypothetical protein ACI9VT_003153 [Psychroserpens sp.]|jgi:hypothetical protein
MSDKEQQGVERGFRFIKDPLFHLSGVFLKKPERIDALMMVMTLCLMVYNAGQYQVRKELEVQEESILSQVGKPTTKPTLRWIFKKISGIHRVHIPGRDSCLSGLNEEKKRSSGYLARKFVECINWFSLSQEYAVLLNRQVWRS